MSKVKKVFAAHKVVAATVLALTIFGAVYGFAATLAVGSNTLSAGNAIVASCDTTGNGKATYSTAYDTTLGAYKVQSVTVTGLDAACNGKTISVTLTGTTGTLLTPMNLTPGLVASGGFTASPGTTVAAKDVTGVSVAING
jgi:hypothetical protein